MVRAYRLDHVGFTARDVESLAAWYEISDHGICDSYASRTPKATRSS
jgi:hypothetical protein